MFILLSKCIWFVIHKQIVTIFTELDLKNSDDEYEFSDQEDNSR